MKTLIQNYAGLFVALSLIAVGAMLFIFNPETRLTANKGDWTQEIRDWNGGKILIVSYPDPILGEQRHIIPYTPSPWEP